MGNPGFRLVQGSVELTAKQHFTRAPVQLMRVPLGNYHKGEVMHLTFAAGCARRANYFFDVVIDVYLEETTITIPGQAVHVHHQLLYARGEKMISLCFNASYEFKADSLKPVDIVIKWYSNAPDANFTNSNANLNVIVFDAPSGKTPPTALGVYQASLGFKTSALIDVSATAFTTITDGVTEMAIDVPANSHYDTKIICNAFITEMNSKNNATYKLFIRIRDAEELSTQNTIWDVGVISYNEDNVIDKNELIVGGQTRQSGQKCRLLVEVMADKPGLQIPVGTYLSFNVVYEYHQPTQLPSHVAYDFKANAISPTTLPFKVGSSSFRPASNGTAQYCLYVGGLVPTFASGTTFLEIIGNDPQNPIITTGCFYEDLSPLMACGAQSGPIPPYTRINGDGQVGRTGASAKITPSCYSYFTSVFA
jgi:hypothetical protein